MFPRPGRNLRPGHLTVCCTPWHIVAGGERKFSASFFKRDYGTDVMPGRVRTIGKSFAALLLVLVVAGCADNKVAPATTPPPSPPHPVHPALSLIPWPAHLILQSGSFTLQNDTAIRYDHGDKEGARVARYLADLVHRSRGMRLKLSDRAGAVRLIRLSDPDAAGKEGYRLQIAPDGVTISAGRTAGLFYGAITLWQVMTQEKGAARAITLPALSIDDAPRFAWRGIISRRPSSKRSSTRWRARN